MKLFRKFYLNKFDNRSIVAFFIFIILINAIAIFRNNGILGDISGAVTMLCAFPVSAIFFYKTEKENYINFSSKDERKHLFAGPISYKDIDEDKKNFSKKVLLERIEHRKNIVARIEKLFAEKTNGARGMIISVCRNGKYRLFAKRILACA